MTLKFKILRSLTENINPQMPHANGFCPSWTETKCSLCTECYTNKDSLAAYIRKMHTRLLIFKECMKGFGDIPTLQDHVLMVHRENTISFHFLGQFLAYDVVSQSGMFSQGS